MSSQQPVTIDRHLCIACEKCLPVCPHEIISVQEGKAQAIKEGCFQCGHCMAACPVEAITVDGVQTELGFETTLWSSKEEERGQIAPADLIELMRNRRSCRNYSTQEVPASLLRDLVRVGITAPSGTNSQKWHFTLVQKRQDVVDIGHHTADYYRRLNKLSDNPLARFYARIFLADSLGQYRKRYYHTIKGALERWDTMGEDLLFHGATAVILISACKSSSCGAEDALLATQNILLAAESVGLGSCLIGFVVEAAKRDKKLRQHLGVADDERLYSVIALGYCTEEYQRPAGRKQVTPRIFKARTANQ